MSFFYFHNNAEMVDKYRKKKLLLMYVEAGAYTTHFSVPNSNAGVDDLIESISAFGWMERISQNLNI